MHPQIPLRLASAGCLAILLAASACQKTPPTPQSGPDPALQPATAKDESPVTIHSIRASQNLFEAAETSLTKSNYEKIHPGMTYDEVVSTLQIPPERAFDDMKYVGLASDVELKWFGGPGENISITINLKGKTVVDKKQTGLLAAEK